MRAWIVITTAAVLLRVSPEATAESITATYYCNNLVGATALARVLAESSPGATVIDASGVCGAVVPPATLDLAAKDPSKEQILQRVTGSHPHQVSRVKGSSDRYFAVGPSPP